jgi:hypothetical protein
VKPLRPDLDLDNADWIKTRSLDLPEIETLEELQSYLESRGKSLEEFKKLPAFKGFMKKRKEQGDRI